MTPKRVLEIFQEIVTIPRESGHEEQIRAWLCTWSDTHSLKYAVDKAGNVLIRREASIGKEDVPTLVLQSHLDMVCEKNEGVEHDFAKDPISYVIEDGWMIARDTTLGADDGIGIAASLALLEDNTETGAIECLFTASEETGMDGAMGLEAGFFTGKTLINLDSEDEGELFVGCSGGLNTNIRFSYIPESIPEDNELISLMIAGGVGGHSGDDINKERVNTLQQIARFVYSYIPQYKIVDICGGGKPNAIARECRITLSLPSGGSDGIARKLEEFESILKSEFHRSDPGVFCRMLDAESSANCCIGEELSANIIRSLYTAPHGVQAMSQDIVGLVQTSTNLASAKMLKDENIVEIVTSQRSSSASERRNIAAKVAANFQAAGALCKQMYEYPGWEPNMDSPILAKAVASYRKLFGTDAKVKAIHAGLECGLFAEKIPGLDMISFGPTLRGVHAPGERLDLSSLDKFVDLLQDIVTNFN